MASEAEPYYLALDPGVHTGWAMWTENGKLISMGMTHSYDELHKFLAGLYPTIKVVIIEDFWLFKNKAIKQSGSRMPAPKAIGQIETFARLWNARIVKQGSNVKPIAEKMTGKSTKGMPHNQTHMIDAFNHGEYYLIKNKIKSIDLSEFKIEGIN